jgi:uncharacterized protein YecE (DUF72 family)
VELLRGSIITPCSPFGPADGEANLTIIATAAWSIPKAAASNFPSEGSGLQRYASVFRGVEINSTFYRRHRQSTFERWAVSVPDAFRFALKIPKEVSHTQAMKEIGEPFETFLEDIAPLGPKRGPLLCQLPPSLAFDADRFEAAFKTMRNADSGTIVIEARHKSWASGEAVDLLKKYAIDRVLADPVLVWAVEDFAEPPFYIRLHGKPRIYYSSYTDEELQSYSKLVAPSGWCVLDNTASGAAIENALSMLNRENAI